MERNIPADNIPICRSRNCNQTCGRGCKRRSGADGIASAHGAQTAEHKPPRQDKTMEAGELNNNTVLMPCILMIPLRWLS